MTDRKHERRFPERDEWFVHPEAWPDERFGPYLCMNPDYHRLGCPFTEHVIVSSQQAGFDLRNAGGGR